jgi:hypothetical protein
MNTSHLPTGENSPEILIVDTQGGSEPHLALLDDPLPYLLRVGEFRTVANMVWPDRMQTLRHIRPEKKGLQQSPTSTAIRALSRLRVMLLFQVKAGPLKRPGFQLAPHTAQRGP